MTQHGKGVDEEGRPEGDQGVNEDLVNPIEEVLMNDEPKEEKKGINYNIY